VSPRTLSDRRAQTKISQLKASPQICIASTPQHPNGVWQACVRSTKAAPAVGWFLQTLAKSAKDSFCDLVFAKTDSLTRLVLANAACRPCKQSASNFLPSPAVGPSKLLRASLRANCFSHQAGTTAGLRCQWRTRCAAWPQREGCWSPNR
jgi:hypothetical protein